MKIVVLDPNGELRDVSAAFHRALGTTDTVSTVTSAHALSTYVGRQSPELVVVELAGDDAQDSGWLVLKRLRARYERLPILGVGVEDGFSPAIDAIRGGATGYIARIPPLDDRVSLFLAHFHGLRRLVHEAELLEEEAERFHRAEDERYRIVGESPQMREVRRLVERVARIPRPVLVLGERGTGKELVARAIHRTASNSDSLGPFVAVNCAALPDTLLESELFGHEKGAFTGAAHTRSGKFEQASNGTLFLDEIGHMSLAFQQKILRVVEYKRFTRVGGQEEIEVRTRIVAATNANLDERLRKGQFLHDLYDRLAFEVIRVPPLREREGEIETLAQYFLDQFMREVPAFAGKRLSQRAVNLLYGYSFPGNVRELKNIIERAVYRDTTNELTPEDIGILTDHRFQATSGTFKQRVAAFERQLLVDTLRTKNSNRAAAARSLGLRYHQLRHLVAKHNLDEDL
jgi:DNA-binding NtrC family response regulator